jgi:hypothetical protein
MPLPFVAFYPAIVSQEELDESIIFLAKDGEAQTPIPVGHPPRFESLKPRDSRETLRPIDLTSFGPTKAARLGDIALARSGDKGANLNIGFFVRDERAWPWLQTFLTCNRMKELMGEDWSEDFFLERVEFENIRAVHFVVYGILGRGVSSSSRLDSLGKGFADFIRDRVVSIPTMFLQ